MSEIISSTFPDESTAAAAVNALVEAGIPLSEISALHSTAEPGHEFGLKKNRKVAEGVAYGGIAGGAVGGVLLGIAGLATISVPPLGLFAAGPVFAALAGIGGGSAAGGLLGALIGAGIPEHEAVIASDRVKAGSVLVAVRVHPDQAKIARDIFGRYSREAVHQERHRD